MMEFRRRRSRVCSVLLAGLVGTAVFGATALSYGHSLGQLRAEAARADQLGANARVVAASAGGIEALRAAVLYHTILALACLVVAAIGVHHLLKLYNRPT